MGSAAWAEPFTISVYGITSLQHLFHAAASRVAVGGDTSKGQTWKPPMYYPSVTPNKKIGEIDGGQYMPVIPAIG